MGKAQVSGTSASGSATAAGRASIIGPGTLRGSAAGVFSTQTCVVFSGAAVLEGRNGSIMLSARGAHACAEGTGANTVSLTGRATVTGGTSAAAGAHGTVPFTGTYDRQSGVVAISFGGRISFS